MTDNEDSRVHSAQSTATFGEQSEPRATSSSGDRQTAAVVVEVSRGRQSSEQTFPAAGIEITSSRRRENTPAKRTLVLDSPGPPPTDTVHAEKKPKSPRSDGASSPAADPTVGQAASSGLPGSDPTEGQRTGGTTVPPGNTSGAQEFQIHSGPSTPRRNVPLAKKSLKSGKQRAASRSSSVISAKFEKVEREDVAKANAEIEALKEELQLRDFELQRCRENALGEVIQARREAELSAFRMTEEIQQNSGEAHQEMDEVVGFAFAECEAATEVKKKYEDEKRAREEEMAEGVRLRSLSFQQAQHFIGLNKLLERHVEELERKLHYAGQKINHFYQLSAAGSNELQRLRNLINHGRQELDRLNGSLETEQEKTLDLRRENNGLRQELSEIRADFSSRARTFDSNLQAANDRAGMLERTVRAAHDQLRVKDHALSELQDKVQKSSSEEDAVTTVMVARISGLEHDANRKNETIVELERFISELQKRNEDSLKEYNDLERKNGVCEHEAGKLKDANRELNQNLQEALNNLEGITSQVDQLQFERDELKKKLNGFNGCDPRCPKRVELEGKVDDLEECHRKLTHGSRGCDPKCPKRVRLEDMIEEREKKLASAEEEIDTLSAEIDELREKSAREASDRRREKSNYKQELHQLESQIAELQDEQNNARGKSRNRRSSAGSSQRDVSRRKGRARRSSAGSSQQGDPAGPGGNGASSSRANPKEKARPTRRSSGGGPPDGGDDDDPGFGGDDDPEEEGEESENGDPDPTIDGDVEIEERVAKRVKEALDSELSALREQVRELSKADQKPKPKTEDDGGITVQFGEDSSDRVIVKKTDTVEKIVIPKFPSVANVATWFNTIKRNVCAATGKDDYKEVIWLDEIQKQGTTFETLANSGENRFKSADMKLAVSLSACIKDGNSELNRELQRLEQDCMSNKKECLRGRQILWMILDYFKTNRDMSVVYTVQDLTNLEYPGDKGMHNFRHYWEEMTSKLRNELTEKCLAEILLDKLRGSQELREDIKHYIRIEPTHEDKTYQYLLRCMDRFLSQQRLDRNRTETRNALKKKSTAAPAPSPEEPKTKAEIRKEKKEKAKAKAAAAKAKAKAKPDPSKPSGGGDPNKKRPCKFYQDNKCNKGKDCPFAHRKATLEELKAMGKARSPSPAPKGGSGKGKGARDESKPKLGQWCRAFLTPKGCTHGDKCIYPHMNEDEVNKLKLAHKNAIENFEKKRQKKKSDK